MSTQKATPTEEIFAAFTKWINQRSGIDFRNYGDVSAFRQEQRTITNQKKRALKALEAAQNFPFDAAAMTEALERNFSGRLSWVTTIVGEHEVNHFDYCTGQYFPTEYRLAASVVLEAYVHAVTPKVLPSPTDEYYDIGSLEIANERAGSYWFSKDNKKFARSRIHPGIYKGSSLIWFVSSEKKGFSDESRAFTVRVFDTKDASVNTAGDGFLAYDSLEFARETARYLLKQDLAGKHIQPLQDSDRCKFCGSYRHYCSGTPTEKAGV